MSQELLDVRLLRRRLEAVDPRSGTRSYIRVLRLLEKFSPEQLTTAVEYALDIDVIDADRIHTIVEHRADQPGADLTRTQGGRAAAEAARFPAAKLLDEFDFAARPSVNKPLLLQLVQGDYLDRGENILLVGPSGTGKSHLAISLGMAACDQGRRVRFFRVTE